VAVASDKIDLGGLSVWPCAGVHSTATADRHVQQRAHNHSDTVVNWTAKWRRAPTSTRPTRRSGASSHLCWACDTNRLPICTVMSTMSLRHDRQVHPPGARFWRWDA